MAYSSVQLLYCYTLFLSAFSYNLGWRLSRNDPGQRKSTESGLAGDPESLITM